MRTGIALGSNLGDRLQNLRAGRDAVFAIPGVSAPLLASRVYETEPVGTGPDADAFLNAVVEVDYAHHPLALLEALQAIETAMGRPATRPKNAPRTLDLDILYVGDFVLSNDNIELPHPRLHLRRFVLQPLYDIRTDLVLPGQQGTVHALFSALADTAAVAEYAAEW